MMQPLLMQQHNAGQQCGVQGHQAGGSYTVYSYPFCTTCQRTPTAEIADFRVGMCEGSSNTWRGISSFPFYPLALVTQPGGRPLSRWISHCHLHFGDFGLAESLGLNFAEPISPERRFSRGGPSLLKGLPSRSRGIRTFSAGSLQMFKRVFYF